MVNIAGVQNIWDSMIRYYPSNQSDTIKHDMLSFIAPYLSITLRPEKCADNV